MTAVPILALIGYATSNGASPVFQKIAADRELRPTRFDPLVLFRLMKDKPYLLGIGMQIVGLILGLVALRVLPLFLVQSVLAASIVVTAITERFVYRHRLNAKTILSIIGVLIGLTLLSSAAVPSHAFLTDPNIKMGLELSPVLLAIIGSVFVCTKNRLTSVLLPLASGLGFGAMALIGRIMTYPPPFWHFILNPLFWALIGFGIIAQFLFVISLQRDTGTATNALVSVTGTLVPAITGILLFNDQIRRGFEVILILGAVIIVIGSLAIARFDSSLPENFIL